MASLIVNKQYVITLTEKELENLLKLLIDEVEHDEHPLNELREILKQERKKGSIESGYQTL